MTHSWRWGTDGGKPDAGKPPVRFDEGSEGESPRPTLLWMKWSEGIRIPSVVYNNGMPALRRVIFSSFFREDVFMMKEQIKADLKKLLPQFKQLSEAIQNTEASWTNHYNQDDPEDLYLRTIFYKISDKLDDVISLSNYVFATVVGEGILRKNSLGHYECGESHYYTSGSPIEFLYYDKDDDRYEWCSSTVEHDGNDYYIVGYKDVKDVKMEGLKVRIKMLNRK
jgi:hypothetical protein